MYSSTKVTGTSFVGRRLELERLSNLAGRSRSWVLAAGRRFGKTMLLRKWERQVGSGLTIVYMDQQAIPAEIGPTDYYTRLLELLVAKTGTLDGVSPSIDGVVRVALDHAQPITLVLDEVEALVARRWGGTVLENLRYAISNSECAHLLSVGLSGGHQVRDRLLTTGSSISNVCDDVFLNSLSRSEIGELVSEGAPESVRADVTELVWRMGGGHPYISQVILEHLQVREWTIAEPLRQPLVEAIGTQVSAWRDALDDLDRDALFSMATGNSVTNVAPSLRRTGLVRAEGDEWVLSGDLLAEALLASQRLAPVGIGELLSRGEGPSVEFKETLRWDVRARRNNREMQAEVVQAVAALMNSDGGHVLIGVRDDATIAGLAPDLAAGRGTLDDWEVVLRNALTGGLGADHSSRVRVEIRGFVPEETVACLSVPRSSSPVYLRDGRKERVFIRDGNTTRELNAAESVRYFRNR